MSRSATTAHGAGHAIVCLNPSRVIAAPNAVYPSTEAAVLTHRYCRPLRYAASLVMSLRVPDPTTMGTALVVRSFSSNAKTFSKLAYKGGMPGKTRGSSTVHPAEHKRSHTAFPATA